MLRLSSRVASRQLSSCGSSTQHCVTWAWYVMRSARSTKMRQPSAELLPAGRPGTA